ncbi:MAG: hypothetical protein EON48_10755 [Acetobacteraceae bacterium]|nr:MAG: hypothetical protein EON48_10755 [Acetobacteraceae bacterium]
MFVIWSGWGILALPIVVGTAVVVGAILQLILTALGRPDLAFIAFSVGLFAAAAANWIIGRRLNGSAERELIDPKTQQRFVFRRRHKLFWINMEYWSLPVALAALVPLLPLLRLGQN